MSRKLQQKNATSDCFSCSGLPRTKWRQSVWLSVVTTASFLSSIVLLYFLNDTYNTFLLFIFFIFCCLVEKLWAFSRAIRTLHVFLDPLVKYHLYHVDLRMLFHSKYERTFQNESRTLTLSVRFLKKRSKYLHDFTIDCLRRNSNPQFRYFHNLTTRDC